MARLAITNGNNKLPQMAMIMAHNCNAYGHTGHNNGNTTGNNGNDNCHNGNNKWD